MTNPEKGEIAFEANGTTYTLQFTIDAICTLEGLLDKSIFQISALLAANRVTAVRAALWAGLLTHHPKITVQQAGNLLPVLKVDGAITMIGKALEAAFGAEEAASEGEASPPTPGEAGTGDASSATGASIA